jgi:hypothetical protein
LYQLIFKLQLAIGLNFSESHYQEGFSTYRLFGYKIITTFAVDQGYPLRNSACDKDSPADSSNYLYMSKYHLQF